MQKVRGKGSMAREKQTVKGRAPRAEARLVELVFKQGRRTHPEECCSEPQARVESVQRVCTRAGVLRPGSKWLSSWFNFD